MRTGLSFVLLLVLSTTSLVNAYDTWLNTFDCPGFCYDLFILPPANGGSIFACYSYTSKDLTTWLVKADNNGDIIWQHSYDLPPRGLAQVPGGGCILLVGFSGSHKLIRLDSDGSTLWSMDLSVASTSVYATSDGYILLRYGSQMQKRDLDGGVIWTIPSPTQMDVVTCFNSSPSLPGGFTVAGVKDGWFQIGIADSSGIVPWTGEFHDPYYEYESTEGVYSDDDGNCFGSVTYSTSYPPPDAVGWVIRIDDGGVLNWSREFPGIGGICPSPEGEVVVTGYWAGPEFFIQFLHSSTGSTAFQILHGLPNVSTYPQDMVSCDEGGYLIGGNAGGDVFLARTDSLGLIYGTGISQRDAIPPELVVSPNPVSVSATVSVFLPTAGLLTAAVHDLTGRRITTLADGEMTAGTNTLSWNLRDSDGRDVPDGLYCIVVTAPGSSAAGRVMVVR
jgi:hypothetical protein